MGLSFFHTSSRCNKFKTRSVSPERAPVLGGVQCNIFKTRSVSPECAAANCNKIKSQVFCVTCQRIIMCSTSTPQLPFPLDCIGELLCQSECLKTTPINVIFRPLTQDWLVQCNQSKSLKTHKSAKFFASWLNDTCLLNITKCDGLFNIYKCCTAPDCLECPSIHIGYISVGTDSQWYIKTFKPISQSERVKRDEAEGNHKLFNSECDSELEQNVKKTSEFRGIAEHVSDDSLVLPTMEFAGVYVLKLEGVPYTHYVGCSKTVLARIKQHLRGDGAVCTARATSIEVRPLLTATSDYSASKLDDWERAETISQMYTLGINKVRGWHYVQQRHSDEDMRSIHKNICSYFGLCFKCGVEGHMTAQCKSLFRAQWMCMLHRNGYFNQHSGARGWKR